MKVLDGLKARLVGLQTRREVGGINVASTIMMAFIIALAMGALSGTMYEVGHALHPDYAGEQAATIADNVAEEIQAAVSYDSSMVAKLDAAGAKTWTQNVTVDNQTATATITVTPSSTLATIDVTVNGESARAFASLSANSIAPGSIITG